MQAASEPVALSVAPLTVIFPVEYIAGNPIPKDKIQHLFERFYRVDESRARKKDGYGLGLAIAKTIVESHDGKINVTSSDSEGTTFTVSFPLFKNK